MKCELQIHDETIRPTVQHLERIAVQVMDWLAFAPLTTVSVVVAADETVQALNLQYRGVDAPTDVLSFPAEPLPVAVDEILYAGDLILAYDHTIQQAAQNGHTPADEFSLLVVHGLLHLAGYDHCTQAEQTVMWAKQADLLERLGIEISVPDFVHDETD